MDGVLVIDKPQGITSHDVVAVSRRALGERRIGHAGTLDPLATGVLVLACGRATRLVRFFTASDKEYEAAIRFGVTTDTYDITGRETGCSNTRPPREAVDAALNGLRGTYLQMPPAYSAKKVAGARAYDLARRAEAVALTAVPVTVSGLEVLSFDGETLRVVLTCSAGFYVRSFAHDLGQRVGTGACLAALRRTRSGAFGLAETATFEELTAGRAADRMLGMNRVLTEWPAVRLTARDRERVAHGQDVDADLADDFVRLLDDDGQLIAVAVPGRRPGSLHPDVVLI